MVGLLEFIDRNKNKVAAVVLALLMFIAGRLSVRQDVVTAPARTEQKTVTEVRYVPKESPADPDVDVRIPKQQLIVRVNGKQQEIRKAENEKYVLDKNKIVYEQSSSATIDLKIPDGTRKWALGIGAGKNGMAGMIKFPLKKSVGGWIAGDKKNVMGGITINF